MKLNKQFLIYFVMFAFGIFSGLSGNHYLQACGVIVADMFMNIFKCISTPIIALSIIVTIAGYAEKGSAAKIWSKTLFYTITTTVFAASVSCILYLIIKPSNINTLIPTSNLTATNNLSYAEHISKLIPTDFITPFLQHQVISVLLIGIMIGFAIRYIPDQEAKQTVFKFFKGMQGLFFIITKWVVTILPLGLYGFITSTIIQFQNGVNIGGIGQYLSVIVIANLIQGFIVLPLWLAFHKINPFTSFKQMMPALSIAFFSKSSSGTLPVTIETAENRLKLHPKITRFVLPLCTTLNMNGCAAFIFTTVIYVMQNQGIEISLLTMAGFIVISTIAAIGNAGVPMGCFLLSASLLSGMNIPILILGIILPFYNVIDMIETALNVWSDSCVANVVNKHYVSDISYAPLDADLKEYENQYAK